MKQNREELLKELRECKGGVQVARFRFSDKDAQNTKKRKNLRKRIAVICSKLKQLDKTEKKTNI